jgi:uncharacterized membrane protein
MGPFTRIFLTLLTATGIYFALSGVLDWHVRLLVGWCGGALFFLVQVALMFAMLDEAEVKARCQRQKNEGHSPMLLGGILIIVVSIAAVIYLLNNVGVYSAFYRLHLAFSLLAIASSWFILQTMFAIYYARLYYQKPKQGACDFTGGLRFSTGELPDYWDFLYFSLTLAMCYSVSDIAITSKYIRHVTLIQTLISFFFFTVIIGLVMNVIGTLFP